MLGIHMHNLFHWWWMEHGIQAEVKENTKTREKPSKAIIACRVREGLVWTNNHNQHWCSNLIKLLMTCHSRAGQMFIDAQYQPHSSSVRVTALAAMSPTTPTHLALPPHSTGGWGGGLESGSSFQVADGGCWAVTMCIHTIRGEGSCVFIYLFITSFFSFSPSLLWPRYNTAATFLEPLPLLFSHLWCGSSHFIVATSSAFTLTRDTHDKLGVEVKVMGCESNAPAPTIHSVDIYTKAARHTNTRISFMCVCVWTQSRTQYSQPLKPCPETKQGLCCKQGGDLDVKHTKKRKQEIEILTSFNSNFDSNMCFSTVSSIQTAALFNKAQYGSLRHAHMLIILFFSSFEKEDPENRFFPHLRFSPV